MKAYELIAWLEKTHPTCAAEDWDNVGLLAGDDRREITHLFLALDLTEETLAQAVSAGADMIVTHHPMIFSPIKKINNHTAAGRILLELIQRGIPYYAMHTNYDVIGMAELSANYLKLTDTRVLSPVNYTAPTEDGQESDETKRVQGFGRVGRLPCKMTLEQCARHVKECNRLNDVRLYGDPLREVEIAAVCTGSGKSMIADALAMGAQVYITGDIDYHTALDAQAEGLALIDAGHYGTEYIFAEGMKKELEEQFPKLTISCAAVKNPYHVF